MKNLTQGSILLVAAAFLSACATTGTKTAQVEDPHAAEKSRAYLSSVELVPLNDSFKSVKACVVPAEADKPAAGQVAGPSKDWKTLVLHANTCVKEKNYKTLEILATAIARIDIDSPWGAYFLSVSAEGSGDWQRALWMADLAQKKAGGRSGLYSYQKARVLYDLKETSLAMKETQHAVSLDPKLAEGYYFLGQIHDRDLEVDQAAQNYQAALIADPKHYGALVNLAELRIQANKADDAATLLTKAVEARPDQLSAWVRLAYVYETVQKNNQLALNTYKNMRSSIEGGSIHGRPDFDLGAKIKTLEGSLAARVPAQAAVTTDKTKSVK